MMSMFIFLCSCGAKEDAASKVTNLKGAPAPFNGEKKIHFALIRQMVEGEFMQM